MIDGKCLLLILMLLPAGLGAAPIYKTTDAQGNIIYTDNPQGRNAQEVNLPPLTIVPSTPLTGLTPGSANNTARSGASSIEIELLAPAQEATIRSNPGDVEVIARINQPLQDGDRFEVYLNGEVRARNAGGTFALTNVDRGTHQVSVHLVDATGKPIVRSASHTFYLHRHSRLHP